MANNLAAFTPIKFSLKLVELLYNDTLYKTITNTDYEGTIKESGDRVRVRTAARVSLSTYTKGMALVKQDLNPTSEDLVVDTQKYFSFGVDDIDKIQNDIPAMTAYAGEVKENMSELIDTDILAYMAKNVGQSAGSDQTANVVGTSYATGTVAVAVTTGVVTGTGTTFTAAMVGGYFKAAGHSVSYLVTAYTSGTSITITDLSGSGYTGGAITAGAAYTIAGATAVAITKSNIYAQIVALRTALGKSLAPKEGRFLVVNSLAEGVLLQAPEFIPAVDNAYNNVVTKGLIGTIAGFKILSSELVAGDNSTGYWFVAGTKDFCSLAIQIMKTSVVPSEADPSSFVSTCKGLLVYGRKVFQGNRARGAVLRCTLS
jgi:hypothetical protein